jgi:carbonic anhydrase
MHGVSAALEFAVQALKVKHIVVLGHARCGGIKAFAEPGEPLSPGDFIGNWMRMITPAAQTVGPPSSHASLSDYLGKLEQASIVLTLEHLTTFPYVRERVECEELALHAAYFDVASGLLSVRDPQTGVFASVAGAQHARSFAQPRF